MDSKDGELLIALSELDTGGAPFVGDARGWPVLARGVPTGHVADLLVDTRTAAVRAYVVELSSKTELGSSSYRVLIPAEQARADTHAGEVHLDALTWSEVALLPHYGEEAPAEPPRDDATLIVSPENAPPSTPTLNDELRMTLFGEQLDIRTRTVQSGEVVVRKRVETEQVREVVPAMREEVVIERRPLPPGVGFEPRVEGDVTYVPLVEEEIVVEKRLVAREELVIRKQRVTEDRVVEETVRREVVDVERSQGTGEPDAVTG